MIMPQNNQQQAPGGQGQNQKKFEIVGLDNVDLRQVNQVDLRQLEVGQGYTFTILGWIKFLQGQYGPYYVIGVRDQNGNVFKITSNMQIAKMIESSKLTIGATYMFAMAKKPGTEYTTKDGTKKVTQGYSYNITPVA